MVGDTIITTDLIREIDQIWPRFTESLNLEEVKILEVKRKQVDNLGKMERKRVKERKLLQQVMEHSRRSRNMKKTILKARITRILMVKQIKKFITVTMAPQMYQLSNSILLQ
jgi:hypothetical protein